MCRMRHAIEWLPLLLMGVGGRSWICVHLCSYRISARPRRPNDTQPLYRATMRIESAQRGERRRRHCRQRSTTTTNTHQLHTEVAGAARRIGRKTQLEYSYMHINTHTKYNNGAGSLRFHNPSRNSAFGRIAGLRA